MTLLVCRLEVLAKVANDALGDFDEAFMLIAGQRF
ncbi:protein of unknown function [Paraburkholderia dioscoreae]|uniref:Uncharacterized protein n=1 Tax=Paraburkholderia dioscoreae TaxID=2604047 RepID=A0A5Q4YSQ4_9BURK|nr:protein of unknown function [Paraburkholderia dioscoreae]